MNDAELIAYSNGSYSTSDTGCVGDTYAIAPRPFPAPGYLREFEDLRKALQEATDACVLQQGVCWVVKDSQVRPRCGQNAEGGCPDCWAPQAPSQGLGIFGRRVDRVVRRWRPVAAVTSEGVAAVAPNGCVLPLWQRRFFNTGADHFTRQGPLLTYQAAVRAAEVVATREGRPRVVAAQTRSGAVVPVVYVQPGGLVRAAREPRGYETQVDIMTPLEVRQYLMASRGGDLMPLGM